MGENRGRTAAPVYGMAPIALLQDQSARAHVCVYLALSSYQGGNDSAWPSYAAIAERAGCSERQAMRSVKALMQSGWIVKVSTGGRTGAHYTANHYRVAWPVVESEAVPAGEHPDMGDTPESARGDMDDTPGVTPMTPPRGDMDDTLKEHIKITDKITEEVQPESASAPELPSFDDFWLQVVGLCQKARIYGMNRNAPESLRASFEEIVRLGLHTNAEWLMRIISEKGQPAHIVHSIRSLDYAQEYGSPDLSKLALEETSSAPTPPAAPRPPAPKACPICGERMAYRFGCKACGYVVEGWAPEHEEEARQRAIFGGPEAARAYFDEIATISLAQEMNRTA